MLSGKAHFGTPKLMEELLLKEKIKVENDTIVDFEKLFWDPVEELPVLVNVMTFIGVNNFQIVVRANHQINHDPSNSHIEPNRPCDSRQFHMPGIIRR